MDWDESSAFCNVCSEDLSKLFVLYRAQIWRLELMCFDILLIFVASSYGLSRLRYGIQGDSLGVLQYMMVGLKRLIRLKSLFRSVKGPLHPCLHDTPVSEVLFMMIPDSLRLA